MSTNRAARLVKAHKVLKKHYKPVAPPTDRTLLEHVLYACCLENSRHEAADEAFAKLQQAYFDWNEVRVTTVTELAEVLVDLPDPPGAASRLKGALQGIFETHYSYDLEFLKKQNQGKAVKELERLHLSPFVLAYATQNGLGGHAIPTNSGALHALVVVGVMTAADAAKRHVPGMVRAIAKSKGVEFGSLLHQLGADYQASPFSQRVRGILVEIDPEAKERLPKRSAKKTESPKGKKTAKSAAQGKPVAKSAKSAAKTPTKSAAKAKAAKKPVAKAKKSTTKKAAKAASTGTRKKSATSRLAKKKPR